MACSFLFLIDDRINHKQQALDWSDKFGWPVEMLDGDQAREHEPTLSELANGALLWPEVGQVRNPRLLAAVREALRLGWGADSREGRGSGVGREQQR